MTRGARIGTLLAAVVTTAAVGVLGTRTGSGSEQPRTVANEVDSPGMSWLHDGLDALHDGVLGASATRRATPRHGSAARPGPPPHSGRDRRVVFDISAQRVWIVGADGSERATYLVSGSRTDNLRPGRYEVFSRSKHAIGYGRHSTMDYFVRFAHGENAAIGFHDIPVDRDGEPVQAIGELGTPQSAGCIRQKRVDAQRMWQFAGTGTRVVVVR